MATVNEAYKAISDVNLWLKIRGGDELTLADMPSIIPLRWPYFRDSWEFIKPNLLEQMAQTVNPDFLDQQIQDFSRFIESQRTSAAKLNPFQDSSTFFRYYAVFDNLNIESINLTNQEDQIMQSEIARVNSFSKNNFVSAKQQVIDYRDRVADIYGLGDPSYNAAFNKSSIPPQINATIVEANFLLTLESSIKTVDFILANLFAVDAAIDPFALARANANNPDINIGQYTSGKLVKINYGESLESLATRYLGDPNSWIDIAIANGLKPPYIDEVGVRIPLLSNGSGNQINLSGTDINGNLNIDKLYINQPIFLQSTTEVVAQQRTIISLREVPVSGEIIIELDGDRNMDLYKTADQAYIRVFAPNTVNSAFYVLIPSQDPLPDDRVDEVPWFLAKSPEDEKRAKIDLAIDDNGELTFTTNGDVKLSYGIDNAIQAIKLKIITELGSLRYHPTFGLVNVIGNRNSNIDDIRELLTQSLLAQVESDSRFDRVEDLAVDYLVNNQTGQGVGAMAISMSVRLAGGTQVIPISFTVNNS
jgi:hypothetical protein